MAVLGVFVEVGIVLPTIRRAIVVVAVALFVAVETRTELTALAAAVIVEIVTLETGVCALSGSLRAVETRTAVAKTISIGIARLRTIVALAMFIATETRAKLATLAATIVALVVKLTSVTITAGTATVVVTARPKFMFVCHKI